MKLCAVVAASDNDVIGRDNALPWHLPADLAHFKRVTMGHPVLMGRRTFESIGKPLPGRRNIVMSRSGFAAPGVETVRDLDEAIRLVEGATHLMVIGGAEIFRTMMDRLDMLYFTLVHCTVEGDVFMPPFDPLDWHEVSREYRAADERNEFAMSFMVLERATKVQA